MDAVFDAVIVGAGPAGSTAAILLAAAGWSVALVEKQRFPRRKVCGECVAASNLPLLAALGIGPAFEAAAGPELRRVALLRGERAVSADLPPATDPKHRWGRALGRETLDTLLLERARASGATVLQPWAVQAIGGGMGDWRIDIRSAECLSERAAKTTAGSGIAKTLRTPIAIAAHGSWEWLPSDRPPRRLLRKPADLFAFKANFRDASLAAGLLPVLSLDGGYGGMVTAAAGATTVACCVRRDRLDACRRELPGASAGDAVEAWLRSECGGVRSALQPARRDGPWLAAGPIEPGIRLQADDRLFRIGNAAGEAHPIIGEGMSMALQSAWLLCAELVLSERHLDRSDAAWQREAGARYAAEWRRHFGPRLQLAAAFAHAAMRRESAVPLMALARAWPGLLTQGARWSGKLRCAADAALLAALMPAEAARCVVKPGVRESV